MKAKVILIAVAFVLCMMVCQTGCILKEKVIEIVLTNETCVDFEEFSEYAVWAGQPVSVDFAEEIEDVLEDAGVSRSEIKHAVVVSASYGVTDFQQVDDWVISGAVEVRRTDVPDGPDTVLAYSTQSVRDALGRMIRADLYKPGVELLSRALEDFTDNVNPILEFTVLNGDVDPDPQVRGVPIDFKWKACLVMHIVVVQDLEVPDPF